MFFCRSCLRQPIPALIKRSNFLGILSVVRALSTKQPKKDENSDVLKSNPYFDKYANKISVMKEVSPDEHQKRLLALLEKKLLKEPNTPTLTQTKAKQLEDVIPASSLYGKSASEISMLWQNSQLEEHQFASSLSSEVYEKIEERSKQYATFLYPLPRVKGFEYFVSQFSGQEVHFSQLINFQTFKENAPECLSVTHFPYVSNTAKLVLVLGDYNTDVLTRPEALCLYHQLQRYYGEDDPRRLRMIQQFTNSPEDFHHMDLIAELERLR